MEVFLHTLQHAMHHALEDSIKLFPILFLTYLLMEYLEHHAASKINRCLQGGKGAGPFVGGLLGLIPQCGFSGAAASFYAGGTITAGTLIAVFLSTSDEMLPILLSHNFPVPKLGLILGLKFLSGMAVGFLVDLLLRKRQKQRHKEIHDFCEQEHCDCEDGIFISALRHTLKIIILIFLVVAFLNMIFEIMPQEELAAVLGIPVLGELLAAVLGLFPNCAASVMISNLYLEGIMGIGPMMAGLLVNAGVGLLVLWRTNHSFQENIGITGVLLASGVVLGGIFSLIFGNIL